MLSRVHLQIISKALTDSTVGLTTASIWCVTFKNVVTLRVTWRYSLFKYIISYYLDHWAFFHVLLCQSISFLCGVQSDILSRYFSGIFIFLLSFKVLCFEYECVLLNECLKTSDLGYGYNQYVRCPSVIPHSPSPPL